MRTRSTPRNDETVRVSMEIRKICLRVDMNDVEHRPRERAREGSKWKMVENFKNARKFISSTWVFIDVECKIII